DVNGDGLIDVVTIDDFLLDSGDQIVRVLLGNIDGSFQEPRGFTIVSGGSSVAAADINGDGHIDLLTNSRDGGSVLLGNGDGSFQPRKSFAVGATPDSVTAADVNGDGRTDIVSVDRIDRTLSVLLGNGDGSFQEQKTVTIGDFPFGDYANSVTVADVNGDGRS